MPTPQKRQSKNSNISVRPQNKVVDTTPLNLTESSETSLKKMSSSNKNSYKTLETINSKKSSNDDSSGGSSGSLIGKNKGFENNSNFGIALGMIETRGLVPSIVAADSMTKAEEVNLIVK